MTPGFGADGGQPQGTYEIPLDKFPLECVSQCSIDDQSDAWQTHVEYRGTNRNLAFEQGKPQRLVLDGGIDCDVTISNGNPQFHVQYGMKLRNPSLQVRSRASPGSSVMSVTVRQAYLLPYRISLTGVDANLHTMGVDLIQKNIKLLAATTDASIDCVFAVNMTRRNPASRGTLASGSKWARIVFAKTGGRTVRSDVMTGSGIFVPSYSTIDEGEPPRLAGRMTASACREIMVADKVCFHKLCPSETRGFASVYMSLFIRSATAPFQIEFCAPDIVEKSVQKTQNGYDLIHRVRRGMYYRCKSSC